MGKEAEEFFDDPLGETVDIAHNVLVGASKLYKDPKGALEDLGEEVEKVGKWVSGGKELDEAAAKEKKAREKQAQLAALQERRQRLAQTQEARIATSRTKASAVASGVAGGSSAMALESNIQQQLAQNLNFMDVAGQLQDEANIFLGQAQRYQRIAAEKQGGLQLAVDIGRTAAGGFW